MASAGYKYLKSYQLSVVIYDLTVEFTRRWIPRTSRTNDQMVQAGRSGKQNIAEGYLEKSLKMYIKLAGVARASLGELLEDYEDFATLINQCCFLLDRQIAALEEKFLREGGYSENLFKRRMEVKYHK